VLEGVRMVSSWTLLLLVHLIGLSLALGAASAKTLLLLRCRKDHAFVPVYLAVARPITRLIILGLAALTLSGIGWLVLGYSFTAVLIAKLILVGAMWVLGPLIDNVAEPRFAELAPPAGELPSPLFVAARNRYVALEVAATATFYVIVFMWVLL
jgi:hypothetical protein